MKEILDKVIKKVILPNYPITYYNIDEYTDDDIWKPHLALDLMMDGKATFEQAKKLKDDLKMLFDMIGTKDVQIDMDANKHNYYYIVSGEF